MQNNANNTYARFKKYRGNRETLFREREPVFVTKNGYGKLVVMDIELYERTIRKIYEAKLVNEDISAGVALNDGDEVRKVSNRKHSA